ncbi:MAG TPA: DUF937 domain-containing protein [Lacipirellulaceae bacterium]|nr:DUF937 domain-containing protein [Lacipirellulaceae bacterium]
MSPNLISSITQIIGSNIITRIASSFGIDVGQVEKAIQGGVPAILAALTSLVSKPGGASQLSNAIAQQQPSLLSDLGNVIGGSGQAALVDGGISTLNSLLGKTATSSLTGALGQYAGVGGGVGKSLVGLLAPVVMGAISQHAKGLDATNIGNLLTSQKANIAEALPAGLSKYLAGTGLLDSVASASIPNVTKTPSAKMPPVEAQKSFSHRQWILPALAVLALLGITWSMRSRPTTEQTATTPPTAQSESADASAPNAASPSSTGTSTGASGADVLPAPFNALDDLRGIKAGDVDVGGQLADAVKDMRTSLSAIQDTSSAQAAVQPLTNSANAVSRLQKLLDQLSPDARKTVADTVSAVKPTLDQLIDKALAIPGVAALIKPTVDSIRSDLNALTTA